MGFRLDGILCSIFGNENSDAGHMRMFTRGAGSPPLGSNLTWAEMGLEIGQTTVLLLITRKFMKTCKRIIPN